jgi:nicotinate-nucleotide adenylyltransferase
VGIFGGTFDPIHHGHLAVADAARGRFRLDDVYLVPAAQPPHRRSSPSAPSEDRLAMARLAAAGRPGFRVSAIELERRGPSYTIDTIVRFKRDRIGGEVLFFLLGYDAFLELHTWKAYNAILQEAALIVLARGGACHPRTAPAVAAMEAYIHRHLAPGYRWDGGRGAFVHPAARTIHLLDGPRLDISATRIRRRLGRGLAVDGLVPAAVADYIRQRGLYR